MGVLSFNYSIFPNLKASAKFFEYKWNTPLIEYELKYERYAALSNTSLFNSPVAATKVATGVCLYDLFIDKIDKKERDAAYFQSLKLNPSMYNVQYIEQKQNNCSPHENKELYLNTKNEKFIQRNSYVGSIKNEIFLCKVIIPNLWTLNVINKYYQDKFSYVSECFERYKRLFPDSVINNMNSVFTHFENNIYENEGYFIPSYKWDIYENKGYFIPSLKWNVYENKDNSISPPNWNFNVREFVSEIIPYREKNINMLDVKTINRPSSYIKFSYPEFIAINKTKYPYSVDMHLTYRIERTEAGWIIFPNENIIRIKDDCLNLLKDNMFAWNYDYRNVNYNDFSIPCRDRWKMNIYEKIIQAKTKRNGLILDLSFVGTKLIDRIFSIMKTDLSCEHDKLMDIMFPITESFRDRLGFNIIEQINAAKDRLSFSIFKNCSTSRDFYLESIFERIYGSDKNLNTVFDLPIVSGFSDKETLKYFQRYYFFGKLNKKELYVSNGSSIKKIISDKSSFSLHEDITLSSFEQNIFKYHGYFLSPCKETVCELSLADFTVKESLYNIVFDDILIDYIEKNLNSFHDIWARTHNKNIIEEENLDTNTQKKQVQTNIFVSEKSLNSFPFTTDNIESTLSLNNFGKKFDIKDALFLKKNNDKLLNTFPYLITINKNGSNIMTYANVFSYKRNKGLYFPDEKIIKISTIYKNINVYNHIFPIQKQQISTIVWSCQNFILDLPRPTDIHKVGNMVSKSFYQFDVHEVGNAISKSSYKFDINDTTELINKIKYEFTIYKKGNFIYKKKKIFNIIKFAWFIYKMSYNLEPTNYGEHVYKNLYDLISLNYGENIHKERKGMSLYYNVDGIIKSIYSVAVSHYLKYPSWEQFDGFIIPISKVRPQTMIDDINDFVKKQYRNAIIKKDDFGTVLAKPGILNFDILLDKTPIHAFLDYINEILVKTNLKATIEEKSYCFKEPYDTYLQYDEPWGYLDIRSSQIEIGVFGYKSSIKSFLYADEWLKLDSHNTIIDPNEFVYTKGHKAELFDEEWLDKLPLMCYYSYDIWGKTKRDKVFDEQQISGVVKSKEVYISGYLTGKTTGQQAMLEFGDFASKGIYDAWYEKGVFSKRLIESSNIFKQMNWVFKGTLKCDLLPNDFGNWAWVEETPDPFQYDKYGIDELLLPEKDTQYENFEDLVFDREHMRPRNPLKEISETEWIAKLPIRHPVNKYKDVGNVYEDSAIKWENYFGIPSSVIHDMSLRYYRIWEKNMFKFSTMTMQQSANLMLEYLWSWIPDYYPLEHLEQAYRAFRLIRWYTECAVINNSQYIISYEYADLAWPDAEHKGKCHIPSDLQEYDPTNIVENSNDTMYSDIAPGHLCLRNNPIYTGSNNIWVTFKIKNKRNTTINLNMYNQSGAVNIYLNDELIDIIYAHGLQKLVYNIRYTGSINRFKIEKKAADNLDNNFIIGHISIANQAFKDLTINFDPVHRAGNQPLNEVAQKLIQFAALHDRKDIAYNEMLTKNLGVSEVYKMLVKYWQLHHENNWKGKRLTIKQV